MMQVVIRGTALADMPEPPGQVVRSGVPHVRLYVQG